MTDRKTPVDSICHLLREDAELAQALPPGRRKLAEATCTARSLHVHRGRWKEPAADVPDAAAVLVLDGLLLRRVSVNGRAGAELLGRGDVIRPWEENSEVKLPEATAWRALETTRLAVLDEHAVERMADYPEVMRRLLDRSLERSRRLTVNMAIVHHPRVDIRLQMLFWHLAERWGRVRNGLTFLPLGLTHSVLADLIAAQRPTVSTTLSDMVTRGIVRRAQDGWLLLAPPPEVGPGSEEPDPATARREPAETGNASRLSLHERLAASPG